jgi:hypothetical protein
MSGRQLQLARRENFFSDPFFSDFMNLVPVVETIVVPFAADGLTK